MLSVVLYASDVEGCVHHLKEALRRHPNDIVALTQLAFLRFLQYKDAEAITLLRKALALNS